MAFRIEIVSSTTPKISELAAALEAAAWATARWFRRELDEGREPPCCLSCADVCYLPDAPSSSVARFFTGGELVQRGRASCGEIAAWYLGVARAKARGRVGKIKLVAQRGAPEVLHAVVELDTGRVLDPSLELRRCGNG